MEFNDEDDDDDLSSEDEGASDDCDPREIDWSRVQRLGECSLFEELLALVGDGLASCARIHRTSDPPI